MALPALGSQQASFQATPVFVLGLQRSGTTWLANLLCQHGSCFGVQSRDHGGIHESVFFSHFSRSYGDLRVEPNFRRFVRDFTQSDYFLLTGLSPSWLEGLGHRTYGAIFQDLMEHAARQRGATHWLEKSPHHTLYCHELAKLFPNAKFVCLLREPTALIPSLISAPWRQRERYPARALSILRSCMTYTLYRKHLLLFAQAHANSILLHYEDLAAKPECEIERLCQFLGLPYDPQMVDVPFLRNSSFSSKRERCDSASKLDCLCMQLGLSCVQLVPERFLYWLNKLKQRLRPEPWPEWVWRRSPLASVPPAVRT